MPTHKYYTGALGEIVGKLSVIKSELEEIETYNLGKYIAEPKYDGRWVIIFLGVKSNTVMSRSSKIVKGVLSEGLLGMKNGINKIALIGELEGGTERSTAVYEEIGYRRIHIHDIAVVGPTDSIRSASWKSRRHALEKTHKLLTPDASKRLPLIEYRTENFVDFLDEVLEAGGEGIMLKQIDSKAISTRKDGKIKEWIKVKPEITVDFILTGFDITTTSKEITGRWSLYMDGVLNEIMTSKCPELINEERPDLVGKVAEFKALEQFNSGILRSPHFIRWRPDKDPEDCIFERKERR